MCWVWLACNSPTQPANPIRVLPTPKGVVRATNTCGTLSFATLHSRDYCRIGSIYRESWILFAALQIFLKEQVPIKNHSQIFVAMKSITFKDIVLLILFFPLLCLGTCLPDSITEKIHS